MPNNGLIAGVVLVLILCVFIPSFIVSYLTPIDGAGVTGSILMIYFMGLSLSGLVYLVVFVKQNW
jgi:hypothetical protein